VTRVVLDVPAIDCPHCSRAITKALQPREGVRSVRVDVPRQQVRLEVDERSISLEEVKAVLAREDYEVGAVTAP
jgi:copper chaperone CopZ